MFSVFCLLKYLKKLLTLDLLPKYMNKGAYSMYKINYFGFCTLKAVQIHTAIFIVQESCSELAANLRVSPSAKTSSGQTGALTLDP